MATNNIGVIYTVLDGTVVNPTTDWAEVIESDNLTLGVDYLILCHALVEGSVSSEVFSWRLVDRSNSDAVVANSTMTIEPSQGTVSQSYSFVGMIRGGSSTGGLALEQVAASGGEYARTQYVSMVLIDPQNLASHDWFINQNENATTLTDSVQDFASATPPNLQVGDQWLVFGWQSTEVNAQGLSESTEVRISWQDDRFGEEFTAYEPNISFENEDLTEQALQGMCRVYTVADSATSWTIQSRMEELPVTEANKHTASTLLGIRLNAFENHSAAYTSAESTTSGTDWSELDTATFTPNTTGDVLVFGTSIADMGNTNRKSLQRIQVDGTTIPNAFPDTFYSVNPYDPSDLLPQFYATKYSGTKAVAATVDLDVKKNSSAVVGWLQYTLAMFSTRIAPVEVFSAVALDTYNSGDVASDSFASGDVASEVNPQ